MKRNDWNKEMKILDKKLVIIIVSLTLFICAVVALIICDELYLQGTILSVIGYISLAVSIPCDTIVIIQHIKAKYNNNR